MSADMIAALRERIMPVVTKRNLSKVVLFGSRARGDNSEESDYDFYVDAPEIRSLFDLGGLYIDFERELQQDVDLVMAPDKYTKIKQSLLDNIAREGV
ncbi:MAG: nucleotidyltransferase domain-containing protein, partial [Acidaminococcaceae bacterium]|nr:nucleotidyltransferase domain-containing protein [Acidaminococcaceae bacterium]